jgi:hypothetical protein
MKTEKEKRKTIAHLAKYYSPSELAECLVECSYKPSIFFWSILDSIRAARAPERLRMLIARKASLEKSLKQAKSLSPAWKQITLKIIHTDIKISIIRSQIERQEKATQKENAA